MEQVLSIAPVLGLDVFVSWENVEVFAQLEANVGTRVVEMQVAPPVIGAGPRPVHRHRGALRVGGGLPANKHPLFARGSSCSRNGVDLNRFVGLPEKKADAPPTFIYSSSPDRGLHHLLNMWPMITESLKDYSTESPCFTSVTESRTSWSTHAGRTRAMRREPYRSSRGSQDGVVYHGKIGQDELAKLMTERCAALSLRHDEPHRDWMHHDRRSASCWDRSRHTECDRLKTGIRRVDRSIAAASRLRGLHREDSRRDER